MIINQEYYLYDIPKHIYCLSTVDLFCQKKNNEWKNHKSSM